MTNAAAYIGIDFGTTNSSMAWYNPRTSQAEIILNAEGEQKTPSVVYFGDNETLVGTPAEEMLEDEAARKRVVLSSKRDLGSQALITLPGRRIKPVEVAAEILRKMKRDAEELHFHEPVTRAVITCPAAFDSLQRDGIEEAGRRAGFGEVTLLEEPVAAALAYAATGQKVGDRVLVYDLGGGTFDLAVVARDGESFQLALEPKGLARCGGDDFDRALYNYCDELAERQLGRPVSLDHQVDLHFLRECRKRKENLSILERADFSSLLSGPDGPVRFRHTLDRVTFEGLIDDYINATVRLTQAILDEGQGRGQPVDTIVLIGGSSRVPLVLRQMKDTLPLAPQKFDKADLAVALGAAYYGAQIWGVPVAPPAKAVPAVPAPPAPAAPAGLPEPKEAAPVAPPPSLTPVAAPASGPDAGIYRPDARLDFQTVDARYQDLRRQMAAGTLSPQAFDAALSQLMVKDNQGRWWSKVRDTGEWQYHDGHGWVRVAGAPSAPAPYTPPAPAPVAPAAPATPTNYTPPGPATYTPPAVQPVPGPPADRGQAAPWGPTPGPYPAPQPPMPQPMPTAQGSTPASLIVAAIIPFVGLFTYASSKNSPNPSVRQAATGLLWLNISITVIAVLCSCFFLFAALASSSSGGY